MHCHSPNVQPPDPELKSDPEPEPAELIGTAPEVTVEAEAGNPELPELLESLEPVAADTTADDAEAVRVAELG